MKELTTKHASGNGEVLEIGKVLGQSIAFGTIAGRCSAAQAAAIRQARTQKVHEQFKLTWNEFCPQHLKISGSQADNLVRLLDEFGPDYFKHTQSVRVSADTYRLVAPFIQDRTLHYNDETLELNSANVQKIAKAVRDAQPQRALPAPAEPSLDDRLNLLDRRIRDTLAEIRAVARDTRTAGPSSVSDSIFRGILVRMTSELDLVAMENGIV